ncbi:acetyl esterase/lipase [Desulfobotulus alkaliphilus]|uniref:Acetyl esterase/lipase n=1 Tax=Desulfobotulus alkaliphilus TaxID=622671 RepID=A0A562S9D5_9BACT|nr:alpha/beta hydrolase [Desulfobotulus alkaliphilus]TWI77394.1 acetyl esterase/lipase [Desulfobotulus alkaliphilus]
MENPSPALIPFLEQVRKAGKAFLQNGSQPTFANAREGLATLTRTFVTKPCPMAKIIDAPIPGPQWDVPVRIYHPAPEQSLPLLLFIHGGGHMAGSIAVYDGIARRLAKASSRITLSVEYRRAPECPYPSGLEDVTQAAKGAFDLLESLGIGHEKRLAIAGDSGGSALAASLSHRAVHEPGLSIEKQILIYPSLDYTLSMPSAEELAKDYLLEKDKILWYFDHYFQNNENRKAASPLFMEIPPPFPQTLVVTAGFCPLKDEGKAYAERLKQAGIFTMHEEFRDMIHAFLNLEDLIPEACDRLYNLAGAFLQDQPII